MTREQDYLIALRRNVLRRQARLPTLDIRVMMQEDADKRAWRAYGATWDAHKHVHEQMRAEFVSDLRARRGVGVGRSAGGRWAIGHAVTRKYAEYLARLGFRRPAIRGIEYGESRRG